MNLLDEFANKQKTTLYFAKRISVVNDVIKDGRQTGFYDICKLLGFMANVKGRHFTVIDKKIIKVHLSENAVQLNF